MLEEYKRCQRDVKINVLISSDSSWFARCPTTIQVGSLHTESYAVIGSQADDWDSAVQEAKSAVTFQANALAQAYGKTLKVSADDILWAMGQVSFHLCAIMSTCPCYHMATSRRMHSRFGQAATFSAR